MAVTLRPNAVTHPDAKVRFFGGNELLFLFIGPQLTLKKLCNGPHLTSKGSLVRSKERDTSRQGTTGMRTEGCEGTTTRTRAATPDSGRDLQRISNLDPIMAATLGHFERRTRDQRRTRGSVCGSRTSSRGAASLCARGCEGKMTKEEMEESLLPYVPKAYELYVLAALPLIPFLVLLVIFGPLLLED